MSKSNNGPTMPKIVKSARDGGYQAARALGRFLDLVLGTMRFVPGLGTDKPDAEKVEEVKAGISQAWGETLAPKPVKYRKEGDDTYILDPNGGVELSAEYALAMTTHEFGRLAPNWKGLVGAIRQSHSKYVSNRFARIESEARRILAEGDATKRESPSFVKWMDNTLGAMEKRLASAAKRGEPGIPDAAALKRAIAAFNAALKRGN